MSSRSTFESYERIICGSLIPVIMTTLLQVYCRYMIQSHIYDSVSAPSSVSLWLHHSVCHFLSGCQFVSLLLSTCSELLHRSHLKFVLPDLIWSVLIYWLENQSVVHNTCPHQLPATYPVSSQHPYLFSKILLKIPHSAQNIEDITKSNKKQRTIVLTHLFFDCPWTNEEQPWQHLQYLRYRLHWLRLLLLLLIPLPWCANENWREKVHRQDMIGECEVMLEKRRRGRGGYL